MAEYELKELSHKEAKAIVKVAFSKKEPVLILGRTGIGKSQIVTEIAKELAAEAGKELVIWNDLPDKEKEELLANPRPDKIFVLSVVPMSMSDIGEFKVPSVLNHGRDYFKYLITRSAFIFTKYEGILFLDEVNLVQQKSLLNMIYQLVLDKRIDEYKLKAFIIAAGNISEDKAPIQQIPAPLMRRFTFRCILKPPALEEFLAYMGEKQFDTRIIAFLTYQPEFIYKIDTNKFLNMSIPATLEKLSNIIKSLKDEEAGKFAPLIIGKGAGEAFAAFLEVYKELDLEEILKNPEIAKNLDRKLQIALISTLSQRFEELLKKYSNSIKEIIKGLPDELKIVIYYMFPTQKAKDEYLKLCTNLGLANKFLKYII